MQAPQRNTVRRQLGRRIPRTEKDEWTIRGEKASSDVVDEGFTHYDLREIGQAISHCEEQEEDAHQEFDKAV